MAEYFCVPCAHVLRYTKISTVVDLKILSRVPDIIPLLQVAQLKKAKRDLEQKVDELEEELEEVSCQVSSLQSAKTKVRSPEYIS